MFGKNEQYDYKQAMNKFKTLAWGEESYRLAVIIQSEKNIQAITLLIENMLKNNSMEENLKLIAVLTYFPNLIGLTLDLFVNEKEAVMDAKYAGSYLLLDELAYQTAFLYNPKNIDDARFHNARAKFETFLDDIKQKAPEHLELKDGSNAFRRFFKSLARDYGNREFPENISRVLEKLKPVEVKEDADEAKLKEEDSSVAAKI